APGARVGHDHEAGLRHDPRVIGRTASGLERPAWGRLLLYADCVSDRTWLEESVHASSARRDVAESDRRKRVRDLLFHLASPGLLISPNIASYPVIASFKTCNTSNISPSGTRTRPTTGAVTRGGSSGSGASGCRMTAQSSVNS